MAQDVDSENLIQTLELMHACDKPPSQDIIEKILGENLYKNLLLMSL